MFKATQFSLIFFLFFVACGSGNSPEKVLRKNTKGVHSTSANEKVTINDSVISSKKYWADVLFTRGNIKSELKDYTGAIQDYNKAIEIDPNFADAYCNRGLARLVLEDKKGGCLDLSKAGELGKKKAYLLIQKYCQE